MPNISIPSVSSPLAPDLRAFVQRVREALLLMADGVITVDQLRNASIIDVTPGGQIVPGSAVGDTNYVAPPSPSSLTATSAVTTIILQWTEPVYSNHSYTEIWRSTSDNLGTAVMVGTTDSYLYADALGNTGMTYYYWVRHVSTANVVGPYNGTAGTSATTGQVGESNLANLAVTSAKIADLAVVEAKIANAAVTNAKIGGFIQSTGYVPGSAGWIINKDGTVEFNNATIRGGVWAGSVSSTAGVTVGVGGNIKGGATAYATGTGFWMGYDGGAYKMSLGAAGGARMTWDGTTFSIYDSSNQIVLASGSGIPWAKISGTGRPEDYATVGATFGVNIGGQINTLNVSTYIANGAIGAAQIGSLALVGTNNFSVRSALSGARQEMDSRAIKVFDANGVKRVQIGDLSA